MGLFCNRRTTYDDFSNRLFRIFQHYILLHGCIGSQLLNIRFCWYMCCSNVGEIASFVFIVCFLSVWHYVCLSINFQGKLPSCLASPFLWITYQAFIIVSSISKWKPNTHNSIISYVCLNIPTKVILWICLSLDILNNYENP